MKRYRRRCSHFPVRLQRWGSRTEMETMFEALQTSVETPATRESWANSWISAATWKLIDNHARLRKLRLLVRQSLHGHNRCMQKSLNADRAQHVANVAENIQIQLNGETSKRHGAISRVGTATPRTGRPNHATFPWMRRRLSARSLYEGGTSRGSNTHQCRAVQDQGCNADGG